MKLIMEVYCPRNEIQKMENELWNLTVKGMDVTGYTQHFKELALLCSRMVPNEEKNIERYAWCLPNNIQGNVTSSVPIRLQDAIKMAKSLMDQKVRDNATRQVESKRKWENNPRDNHYKLHHVGPCIVKCSNCKKVGHMAMDCKAPIVATNQRAPIANQKVAVTCYECGRLGYYKSECPKLKNQNHGNLVRNKEAQGRAFALGGGGETNQDSNVIAGMVILNNCYASILFDSGDDRSFMSTMFSPLIDIVPFALDTKYTIELPDRKIIGTDAIIKGCTLNLLNHPFNIDLMPIDQGSFDVFIGMDWLSKYYVMIVCDEKVVRIPFDNLILMIQGDRNDAKRNSRLNIISCTKTQKYIQKGLKTDIQEQDKKKAKSKQSRARNGKDKVKLKPKSVKVRKSTPTKSKVNQMKKIQLEGLKLPNLKLYYKKPRAEIS
ncbi:reverse transcriptase domain-containing protein [Tanacetum coccineum]